MAEDRLSIGLDQTQRMIQTQLSSVDSLDTKIGVLLGFASTSLVILFSFGQSWAVSHLAISVTSAAILLLAVSVLGASLMFEDWADSPSPAWLVGLINDEKNSVKEIMEKLIGDAWGAYDHNRRRIEQKFFVVNIAIVLTITGTGIFIVGVLIT